MFASSPCPIPSPGGGVKKQWNGHMAKDKKAARLIHNLDNYLPHIIFKQMKRWLVGLEFRVGWEELSALSFIRWQTLISILRAVAGGQYTHPSWSQRTSH